MTIYKSEMVDEFKYLGINTRDWAIGETIRKRIALGERAFERLSKIWRRNTKTTR